MSTALFGKLSPTLVLVPHLCDMPMPRLLRRSAKRRLWARRRSMRAITSERPQRRWVAIPLVLHSIRVLPPQSGERSPEPDLERSPGAVSTPGTSRPRRRRSLTLSLSLSLSLSLPLTLTLSLSLSLTLTLTLTFPNSNPNPSQVRAGDELCNSYVDSELPYEAVRRPTTLHPYPYPYPHPYPYP